MEVFYCNNSCIWFVVWVQRTRLPCAFLFQSVDSNIQTKTKKIKENYYIMRHKDVKTNVPNLLLGPTKDLKIPDLFFLFFVSLSFEHLYICFFDIVKLIALKRLQFIVFLRTSSSSFIIPSFSFSDFLLHICTVHRLIHTHTEVDKSLGTIKICVWCDMGKINSEIEEKSEPMHKKYVLNMRIDKRKIIRRRKARNMYWK